MEIREGDDEADSSRSLHRVRSLPDMFVTAYPRRQCDCPDQLRGLASVEALYVAYFITGRNTDGLLDNYHWKELFLEKNREAFQRFLAGE
jgi:pre-rRNA-processing protein TSR3